MCIGLPGVLVSVADGMAVADTASGRRAISVLLVPEAAVGDHVLLHAGLAMRVISAAEAASVAAALAGAEAVLGGATDLDHFFPDLAGRVPALPPHLEATQ